MKEYILKNIAVLFLVSGSFIACEKEDEFPYFQCTMTTESDKVTLSFNTQGKYQTSYTIDWGDGQKETGKIDTWTAEKMTHFYAADQKTPYTITVDGGVTELDCSGNQLTSLIISGPLLKLYCSDNLLTSLNLTKLQRLEFLNCENNPLHSIDIGKSTKLTNIDLRYNLLTSLDVSKNTKLTSIDLHSGLLTSLDVSKNTKLNALNISSNRLTSLDVSKNTRLGYLFVDNNQLDAESLNSLFRMLPNSDLNPQAHVLSISRNPGTATCDITIARSKGWSILD